MAIRAEVRKVEGEIDESVRYRGAGEVLQLKIAWAAFQEPRERARLVETVPLVENRIRAGVFYVLKWALTLCPERSTEICDEMTVHSAQEVGAHYETLVDSLRLANHGLADIEVDRLAHLVTVYEGGDMTGGDWALVEHQRRTNPFRAHVPLTEDADQLTAAWTAGDYRRTAAWQRDLAAEAQCEQTVMFAPPGVVRRVGDAYHHGSGEERDRMVTIASDPGQTFDILSQRAGLGRLSRSESQHERTCDIMGWSRRPVDARPGVSRERSDGPATSLCVLIGRGQARGFGEHGRSTAASLFTEAPPAASASNRGPLSVDEAGDCRRIHGRCTPNAS